MLSPHSINVNINEISYYIWFYIVKLYETANFDLFKQ